MIAVFALIYWREEELEKIKRLMRKLKYMKQKFKKETKPIEFEEVEHAYSEMSRGERKEDKLSREFNENMSGEG